MPRYARCETAAFGGERSHAKAVTGIPDCARSTAQALMRWRVLLVRRGSITSTRSPCRQLPGIAGLMPVWNPQVACGYGESRGCA